MINFTVLKVRHCGQDEAKKLRPYMGKNYDVYAPEAESYTEKYAELSERSWEKVRTLSRSRMLREVRKFWESTSATRETVEYRVTVNDLLFRAEIEVYNAERYSDEEARALDEQMDTMRASDQIALGELVKGNVNAFYERAHETIKYLVKIAGIRDKHMASVLDAMEPVVRDRYSLDRDPLRVVVPVGAVHTPEKHMSHNPIILSLFEEDYHSRLLKGCAQGKSLSELREDMLIDGLQRLGEKGTISLPSTDLESMNLDELVAFTKSVATPLF